MLFILYTSGTTGKPKESCTRPPVTCSRQHNASLRLRYQGDDVYWLPPTSAGHGHSYIVYVRWLMAHDGDVRRHTRFPDRGRFWSIVDKYGANILYTAPTAIRTFMRWARNAGEIQTFVAAINWHLGEPINPEAWMCITKRSPRALPIVDTWWQTETGSILISPLPGITATNPVATRPLPGIVAEWWTPMANRSARGGGYLILSKPWPSMLRTIYGSRTLRAELLARYPGNISR